MYFRVITKAGARAVMINGDVNKGKKRKHDVSMETSDNGEIILKRRKTSEVSLRRSARVQLQKNQQRKTLAQLKKQMSKQLAGEFVLEESDVTYRAPKGFYGDFGVPEINVQGKTTMNVDNEDEVEDAGSSGSSTEKVVIKKPKKGFINNELFPPDDEDISDTTLKNNISVAIEKLREEDIEVNQLLDRDVTNHDATDPDGTNRDVTDPDVTTPDKMNLFNRDRKVLVHTSDDEYRVDKTPGIIDERWRIKCNSYPVDNRGFGQHRNVLNQMQGRDTRDQNLIQILHDVINPEQNKDDDDVADYDEDVADYDEDDVDNGNGEEISDGNRNGDVSETGNGASNNDYSDTSSYTNTTDKMPKEDTASATSPYDLSLSIEDGNKPQEKLNIDNQSRKHDGGTVEKRDVKGGKNQIPQTPKEKHDVNSDGVTVGEEKCHVNSSGPQTPKEKHDVNSDGVTVGEEKRHVNSGGPQTPKEKHDVNSDGVTVGEEKCPDTNPEPQEGDVMINWKVNSRLR